MQTKKSSALRFNHHYHATFYWPVHNRGEEVLGSTHIEKLWEELQITIFKNHKNHPKFPQIQWHKTVSQPKKSDHVSIKAPKTVLRKFRLNNNTSGLMAGSDAYLKSVECGEIISEPSIFFFSSVLLCCIFFTNHLGRWSLEIFQQSHYVREGWGMLTEPLPRAQKS